MIPSSFCALSTYNCHHELYTMLLSLSIYHRNALVICVVDTKTKDSIESYHPKPRLNIKWEVMLDKYSDLNRKQMEAIGVWDTFQMMKAKAIEVALIHSNDTLFLDSDIIILDTIDCIDNSKQLGVSPHYIKKKDTDKFGYYNGGVLWTNQKTLPNNWIEFTKKSRFYDQASIEELVKNYDYFEFDENYNMSWWRMFQSELSPEEIYQNFNVIGNQINYKNKPLKFVHTHFYDKKGISGIFNKAIIDMLTKINDYKSIQLIYREINKKWIFSIPHQPLQGKFSHNNDSYRTIPKISSSKYREIKFIQSQKLQCWLEPNIILYDRPTVDWTSPEMEKSNLIMLANGSLNVEGKYLYDKFKKPIKPWLFWPRFCETIELSILLHPVLKKNERNIESIFIGNYENSIQSKYRNTNTNWSLVIQEFHNTSGSKHKFTQEQYIDKIRNSCYGLCLRGFGSKCHREVELMAFGTVPIITPEVSINDYINPPIENKHYIKANNPKEAKEKITSISDETWEEMSNNCRKWYYDNIHTDNFLFTTLDGIFYS